MTAITPNNGEITALVTGANRGLGKRFAAELVARGAKVYAAARRPETVDVPGVIPVALDITDPESVRRAAEVASDVNVVVNNAGVSTQSDLAPLFRAVVIRVEGSNRWTSRAFRTLLG